LHDQQLLLVLDNFEQVVAAAPVLSDLLAGAPQIKIMVTSREVLDIYGEQVHPVPPLGLPDLARHQSPASLSQFDAVSLFVQRAQAARFGFAFDESNADAVAEICVRLDGLPLAIELAAARVALFSPAQLLARLGERLKTVAGGMRGLPERQRTLRGAIDWSFGLLSSDEKHLFARLAVFEGGLTYDSAEAVCGPGLDLSIMEGLQSLIKKSLIQALYETNGNSRFVMLETLHEYAREQLAMSGEGQKISGVHARHFLELAERAGAGKKFSQRDLTWMQEEAANYLSAIEWSLACGETDLAARLTLGVCDAWDLENRASLMLHWLERVLSVLSPAHTLINGRLLNEKARALSTLGRMEESRELTLQSLSIFQEKGDDYWTVKALLQAVSTTFGRPSMFAQGRHWQDAALDLAKGSGDSSMKAFAQMHRGELFRDNGNLEEAKTAYESALRLANANGFRRLEMMLLGDLSLVCFDEADYPQALKYGLASLAIASQAKSPGYTAEMLGLVAEALAGLGRGEAAAQLFGASAAILDRLGISIQPQDLREYERGIGLSKSTLSPERFDILHNKGASMTIADAVAYAGSVGLENSQVSDQHSAQYPDR
jgi:predicted ATPase